MVERMMSGLVIIMGLIATGVGITTAMSRLRVASRAYRRTATLYASMPEGWTSWFLGGFSSLTVGSHWLWATVALTGWTVAGAFLIGLGLQLLCRP